MKQWKAWAVSALGLGVAVCAVSGRASLAAGAAAPGSVEIEHFAFTPARIEVPVGTTVTWRNDDEEPHTVTSSTGAFASNGLDHEETFSRRFTEPGTYVYFCALHPRMTGTVIVKGQ